MSLLSLPHISEWKQEHYDQLRPTDIVHLQMILEKRLYELDTTLQDKSFKYHRRKKLKQQAQ